MKTTLQFRKAAWFVPVFFLNVLFLGTSHVLSRFPIQYWALYVYVMMALSTPLQGDVQAFYDIASSVLVVLMIVLSWVAFRERGPTGALLRVLQVSSLSFLPLGIEVLLFDRSEWNLHFAKFQVQYNVLPWFTNADLFYLSLGVAVATVLLSVGLDRESLSESKEERRRSGEEEPYDTVKSASQGS